MREVQLTQGKVAQIDETDWPLISAHKWRAALINRRWYAVASVDGNNNTIYLHRFLMGAPRGTEVDHVDGDGLNCSRQNMRLVTHQQNAENLQGAHRDSEGAYRDSFTGVRGVTFDKRANRYQASIFQGRRHINLGSFATLAAAEQAAIAGRRKYMTHSPECTEKAG